MLHWSCNCCKWPLRSQPISKTIISKNKIPKCQKHSSCAKSELTFYACGMYAWQHFNKLERIGWSLMSTEYQWKQFESVDYGKDAQTHLVYVQCFPWWELYESFSQRKKCMSGFMMCHRKYFMCTNCRMERLDVFACDEYQLVSVSCLGHAVQNAHILCRNIVCTYLLGIIYALHPSC